MFAIIFVNRPGGKRPDEPPADPEEEEPPDAPPVGPDVVDAANVLPPNNIAPGGIPAGLSETAHKRVTLDPPPTAEELEKVTKSCSPMTRFPRNLGNEIP